MIVIPEWQRFLRFLLAGGTAALVGAIVRWALSRVMSYELAVALAYFVGMTVAFVLSAILVFDRSQCSARTQYVRFVLVNAVAFPQVWLVSVGLARFVFPVSGFHWHPDTAAHLIGLATPVWSSYLGHKHFTFGSRTAGKTSPAVATAAAFKRRALATVADLDPGPISPDCSKQHPGLAPQRRGSNR
jgi:putative flippase GtrA